MNDHYSAAPEREPIAVGDHVTIAGDRPGVFYRVVGFSASRFPQALCQSVTHADWPIIGVPCRELQRIALDAPERVS